MRLAIVGGFLGSAAVCAGCVAHPQLLGPLPVRNQHPAQLIVQHMAPATATTMPAGAVAGRADLAYSSLFLSGGSASTNWRMDGEYLRVGTSWRVGLSDQVELSGELPFAHTSGGFLDSFLIDYHDVFGLPDQGRDENPRDAYTIRAQKGGRVAWSVDAAGLELLDVPLQVTWQLSAPGRGRLGAAVRAGVELPTGNDGRGFGNGELDASFGVLLDSRALGIGWFGHAQHTLAGSPAQSRRAGLHFADVTSIGLATELPITTDLHAFVQFEWETSTLRELGFATVARDQLLLWLGARWRTATNWGLELGVGEDLQGFVSPDLTFWFGGTWLPGLPGSPRAAPPPCFP